MEKLRKKLKKKIYVDKAMSSVYGYDKREERRMIIKSFSVMRNINWSVC